MSPKLEVATPHDAPGLARLRCAVAQHLTDQYGVGPWTGSVTEKGVLLDMRSGVVYAMRQGDKVIASLTLGTKKPWAIDPKYFIECQHPLYLTSMAVAPELQRQGLGRLCLAGAIQAAQQWPGDAIRLDAYEAKAGAGEFYRRCGFREVGRASYRNVPLIYFERLI